MNSVALPTNQFSENAGILTIALANGTQRNATTINILNTQPCLNKSGHFIYEKSWFPFTLVNPSMGVICLPVEILIRSRTSYFS